MDAGPPSQFSIELPASMESWDELMSFSRHQFEACIPDKSKSFKLLLAVEELLSNIVRSANRRLEADSDSVLEQEVPMIRISSTLRRRTEAFSCDELIVDLYDTCPPFDPCFDAIPVEMDDTPAEARKIGGLGLFLVKSSVDHVHYSYENGFNHYRLRVTLGDGKV